VIGLFPQVLSNSVHTGKLSLLPPLHFLDSRNPA